MIDSQRLQILRHLAKGKSLTPMEALKRFGCFRLGARAWELRWLDKWPVESKLVKRGKKHVSSYFIPAAKLARVAKRIER